MTETLALDAVDEFISEGLVSGVLSTIKSGKEATAYLCRGSRSLGRPYVVAKVYHDRTQRNFANDSVYEVGERLLRGRAERAVAHKTDAGRAIHSAMWVDHEFEVMSALKYADVDVPEPIAATENAILMEYIGTGETPAPQLRSVRLDRYEAEALLARILWNIETMLRENCIHGDLSPYNILYRDGAPVIIDLPQTVDPRFNKKALPLLERDVRNVAGYFERCGVQFDPDGWTRELWERFLYQQL